MRWRAALRGYAGATLRGALFGALLAGIAGMAWASHTEVWAWADYRADALGLTPPPPFRTWLLANIRPPWHILEYSPWWTALPFGPGAGPANIWNGYLAWAWQPAAIGAGGGALIGLGRGVARWRVLVRSTAPAQDPAPISAESRADETSPDINALTETVSTAAQGSAPPGATSCAAANTQGSHRNRSPVALLRETLAIIPDDGPTLEQIATYLALGPDQDEFDTVARAILKTALRETGWTMQRTKRLGTPVELWWKPTGAIARATYDKDRSP